MSKTDFSHPLLGLVVRLDPAPQVLVRPVVTPDLFSTPGEWGGLTHASMLLSRRFPERSRMYEHHMPKGLSRSTVHEASIMFADDLTVAATRGFRESKRGLADVEMAWLVTHLRVERWREALLWTWAVAKVGGAKGVWDREAREEVQRLLSVEDGQEDEVLVTKGLRVTLDDAADVMAQAGWDAPTSTQYVFCERKLRSFEQG